MDIYIKFYYILFIYNYKYVILIKISKILHIMHLKTLYMQ